MNALNIVLSPEEHAELSRRVRSATISQRDGRRARVILLAAQGCTRVEISPADRVLAPRYHVLVSALPGSTVGRFA